MTEYCSLYITFPSDEEARSVAKHLLEEKLIACANIYSAVTSLYTWGGGIQSDQEVIMFAKTTAAHSKDAVKKIVELHSYECPCVLELPITGGNDGYFDWMLKQLR